MHTSSPLKKRRFLFIFCLGAVLNTGHAAEILPVNQPAITSLAIVGTNLIFEAAFPAGVDQAVLELQPTLTADWQEVTLLDVPTNGGNVEFSIPQPALETAFFRLNTTIHATPQAESSGAVQYMAVPSLARTSTNTAPPAEAVFHFKGQIDGSDRIFITHKGAYWEHVNWDWPAGEVMVNDSKWKPLEKNFMTTTGAIAFLPETYSLAAATLEVIEGRDLVALERTNNALIVYLDDTPSGAATYEFKIHFHQAMATPADIRASPAATLRIAAQIDGSDRLKVTAREATWTHLAYAMPDAVKLNDIPWDLSQTNVLLNAGTNEFLPPGIDFSTARIVHREGRDVATMWAGNDAVWVSFADNPNGRDAYELEISFGQ
jgi:hypothetical protein